MWHERQTQGNRCEKSKRRRSGERANKCMYGGGKKCIQMCVGLCSGFLRARASVQECKREFPLAVL